MFFVYILLCADRSFYVGYTSSLRRRLFEHNKKWGSRYLQGKLPVKLVYYEELGTELLARKRERQIKGWTREKKIRLIKRLHQILNCQFSIFN